MGSLFYSIATLRHSKHKYPQSTENRKHGGIIGEWRFWVLPLFLIPFNCKFISLNFIMVVFDNPLTKFLNIYQPVLVDQWRAGCSTVPHVWPFSNSRVIPEPSSQMPLGLSLWVQILYQMICVPLFSPTLSLCSLLQYLEVADELHFLEGKSII